jgi:nucleoside-diphosphate-sugar epimerase
MINPLANDLDDVLSATASAWEELRNNRIFITGGTGFFGCWLLETFAWINDRLNLNAMAVVLTRDPERLREQAPHLAGHRGIQLHVGDIRDYRFPEGSFTHVIHAATEASAILNTQQPELMLDTIVRGTARCLQFAARSGARKFLLTSSGAVYGTQPPELTHTPETFAGSPDVLLAGSAYGEGKRIAELQSVLASRTGKLEAKIARCFAFAGPYMKLDQHFAIGNFMLDALQGGPIVVKGDGTPLRSYLYASDLMTWLWTILFRGETCRAYNVGSEDAVSVAELARLVAKLSSPDIVVQVKGTPLGGPAARYVPCTNRARTELGLQQRISLADAIQKTVNWLRHRKLNTVNLAPVAEGTKA